ncbi:MAG: hypothetical protein JWQ73_1756 [Variovorax sp.]|nr:hypothetical protein [Variovorax sp.]
MNIAIVGPRPSTSIQEMLSKVSSEAEIFSSLDDLSKAMKWGAVVDLVVLGLGEQATTLSEVEQAHETLGPGMPLLAVLMPGAVAEVRQSDHKEFFDFLVRPFSDEELVARIQLLYGRLIFGRIAEEKDDALEVGPYRFEASVFTIHFGDHEVHLQPKRFRLARLLFGRIGRTVSRREIYEAIWPRMTNSRVVDTAIAQLRSALELKGEHGFVLRSVHGTGYCLIDKTQLWKPPASDRIYAQPLISTSYAEAAR